MASVIRVVSRQLRNFLEKFQSVEEVVSTSVVTSELLIHFENKFEI